MVSQLELKGGDRNTGEIVILKNRIFLQKNVPIFYLMVFFSNKTSFDYIIQYGLRCLKTGLFIRFRFYKPSCQLRGGGKIKNLINASWDIMILCTSANNSY